jgi:hypothetical protein
MQSKQFPNSKPKSPKDQPFIYGIVKGGIRENFLDNIFNE